MLGNHSFKAVVLCAALSVFPQVATAQFFNQLPTERTLQQLDRSLGRLSSKSGPRGSSRNSDISSGALTPGSTLSRPRGRGAAGAGYDGGFAAPRNRGSGSSLLNRRYAPSGGGGGFGGGAGGGGRGLGYGDDEMSGLILRRPDAFMTPGDATGESALATRPADLLDRRTHQTTLGELAKDYVRSRRDDYLARGWLRFQQGDYRAACDVFSIAQSAGAGDRKGRVEVYAAILCAAVAANQQERAINALRWLLTPDPLTGELPDPQFLTHFQSLSSRYTDQSVLRKHVQMVEMAALADPTRMERQALRSVMLWARGDRANALFYARSIKSEQWSRLAQVIEQASAAPRTETLPTTRPAIESEPILLPPNFVAGQ